jgi:hypothetical protein
LEVHQNSCDSVRFTDQQSGQSNRFTPQYCSLWEVPEMHQATD